MLATPTRSTRTTRCWSVTRAPPSFAPARRDARASPRRLPLGSRRPGCRSYPDRRARHRRGRRHRLARPRDAACRSRLPHRSGGDRRSARAFPRVRVVVLDLPHWNGAGEVMHLMSFISPLDRDLALVYPRIAPVRLLELLAEHGIEIVEVPDDEFETMAPNVLALGPRRALALAGNDETRRRLERCRGGRRHLHRRPHLPARRRWSDVSHTADPAALSASRALSAPRPHSSSISWRCSDSPDTPTPTRRSAPGRSPQAAIEEAAGEVSDPLGLVDRSPERRRPRADREVCVAELRRHRSRRDAGALHAIGELVRHPARSLRAAPAPLGDVPLERLLDGDRHPLGLQLEVAGIDAECAVPEEQADRPGQHRAQLHVGQRREGAHGRHAGRGEPLFGAWAPRRAASRTGNGARKRASLPGGTTVIPPGLRRSEATLQTTFERRDAERARERGRGPHRRLHRLGDGAGAGERRDDGAEIEIPLVDPHLLDPRHDLANRASTPPREYWR